MSVPARPSLKHVLDKSAKPTKGNCHKHAFSLEEGRCCQNAFLFREKQTLDHLSRRKGQTDNHCRLCCENCAGRHKDRSKRFADRDLNAAANILLTGTSSDRPASLSRNRKRPLDSAEVTCHGKKTTLSVDPERPSSDPAVYATQIRVYRL